MDKIIEVQDLEKSYGAVHAVRGISFYVERGKLFAFLGPNGAGKSTTIDIICTLLQPNSGSVRVNGWELGKDDAKIRSSIGVVFQDNLLDKLLTIEENMKVRAGFYELEPRQLAQNVETAANAAGVKEFWKRPYGKLSGGQRRRGDIARSLVNTPKILFLDEPTTGLDPQTRKNVWEIIRKLQVETEMTIFLTTHYMEEAADADYVIVIDDGKIAAKGTPNALKSEYASDFLKLTFSEIEAGTKALRDNSIAYEQIADQYVIRLPDTLAGLPIIDLCKPFLKGVEVLNGTMDDAFIGITGKEIRQ